MKKFEQKDVFINTLKVYPKVKIFTYSGKFYYNSQEEGPKINDFLLGSGIESSPIPEGALFTDTLPGDPEEPILTEDGEYIIIE